MIGCLEARFPYHDSRAKTRSPSPCTWRPDFPGVESEKVGLKLNIQKTEIMASSPITSWEIDGETVETLRDFIFWGSKIIADGDYSHEIMLSRFSRVRLFALESQDALPLATRMET